MFRPKDKHGLFIYTSNKANNGKGCAMWIDSCDNNHKAEIIYDIRNVNTDILEIILISRTHQKIIYAESLRELIPTQILNLCTELRYCYTFRKFILIIRKQPKGTREKFKGFYFQIR